MAEPHSILPDIREAFRLRGDEGVEIRMQVLDAVHSLEEQLEAVRKERDLALGLLEPEQRDLVFEWAESSPAGSPKADA